MCFLALMMSEIITAPIIVSGHFRLHHSRRTSLYRKRGAGGAEFVFGDLAEGIELRVGENIGGGFGIRTG
jgi:hypothetical protein